ncbi:hypothetical protein Tco_1143397 [Tanacetum coccineum]
MMCIKFADKCAALGYKTGELFLLTSMHYQKHKKEPKGPPTEPQAEQDIPFPLPSHDPLPSDEDSLKLKEWMVLCTNLSSKVRDLESDVIDNKSTHKAKVEELECRVAKLEDENRMLLKEIKGVHSKVDSDEPVIEKEESSKQGRKIQDIDHDVEINLVKDQAKMYNLDLAHQEKVLTMQDVQEEDENIKDDVQEVVEVVKVAKLISEVVSTAGVNINAASVQDIPVSAAKSSEATKVTVEVPKPKRRRDRGKAEMVEEPEIPNSRKEQIQADVELAKELEAEWNDVIEQVQRRDSQEDDVMKYTTLKRKPLTVAQARRK